MRNIAKRATAGAVLGGSLFFTAGLGIATAQPVVEKDGLVDLSIRDITILEGVSADQAAKVASNVCDVTVEQATTLINDVDQLNQQKTVCDSPLGPVTLTQNIQQTPAPGTVGPQQATPGALPGDAPAVQPGNNPAGQPGDTPAAQVPAPGDTAPAELPASNG